MKPSDIGKMVGPKPIVPDAYSLYLDSFYNLDSERTIGQGVIGNIPVTKIHEYGNWLDIDDLEDFTTIVQAIDGTYVSSIRNEISRQLKAV